MNVIGAAYVTISSSADSFEKDLRSNTNPAFVRLGEDGATAGRTTGARLAGGVTEGTKGIEGALETVGTKGGNAATRGMSKGLSGLTGVINQMTGGFLPLQGATDALQKHLDAGGKSASGFAGTLSTMGGATVLGAAAGLAVFSGVAIKMDLDFQKSTAGIASSGAVTQKVADDIGKAFLNTGGSTEFSANTMAQSFAKVSGQVKDMSGGVLNANIAMNLMTPAMDLATASGGSLAGATSSITKVMQAFGLTVKDSPLISNVLFNAARETGMSVDAMGSKIAMAKTKMGAASPSVQELSGLLVDLTNHGVSGRAAMGVLGTGLGGLVAPTDKVIAAQQAMGVSFIDANGKLKPLGEVIGIASGQIKGMGDQQAIALLKSEGFGGASSKLLSTIRAGGGVLDGYTAGVAKAGSAHAAADKQSQTLKGSINTLKASVEDSAVKWGGVLIPILTKVAQKLASLSLFVINHKVILVALGVVVAALGLTMIGIWIYNTIAAMAFWAAATGGIIVLVAALAVGIAWIVSHWSAVWATVKKVVQAAWDFIDGIVHSIASGFNKAFQTVHNIVNEVWGFIVGVFHGIRDAAKEVVEWITSHWQLLLAILTGPIGLAVLFIKNHWTAIINGAKAVIDTVAGFFTSLPGKIVTALGNIVETIWAGLKNTLLWIYNNVELPVINWFTGLPMKAVTALGDIVGVIWHALVNTLLWIYTNVELPVINWFTALPGKAVTALGDIVGTIWGALKSTASWIDTNVLQPVVSFFSGLPGRLVTGLGNIVGFVFSGLSGAWAWIKTNCFDPIVNGFTGLPGAIGGAVSGALSGLGDIGKQLINWIITGLNAMIKFYNDHNSLGPFGLPDIGLIPHLAGGGVVKARSGGTLVLAGEGGEDEAVVPLGRGLGAGPKTASNSAAAINTTINLTLYGVDMANLGTVRTMVQDVVDKSNTELAQLLLARNP